MSLNTPPAGDHNPYSKDENPQPQYGPPPVPPSPYQQSAPYQQDGGYQHPGYGPQGQPLNIPPQQGYQQPAPYGYTQLSNPAGKSKADQSVIFGVIGVFFFPLVFGILAIMYAKQAEDLGYDAKIGKVVGWIDIGLSVIGFLYFVVVFGGILAGSSSY